MAGIQDIAKKVGVSVSTVSYALNGSPKVTEKTRAKILKIAHELNYTPNLAGRILKKQKNNIIGIYISDFGGYFYNNMIDGVTNILKKNKYEAIIATGGDRTRQFIPQGLVDGAIVLDSSFPNEAIKHYSELGKPIVVMDRKIHEKNVRQVLLDNNTGAKQAINFLNKKNVSSFVLITGPSDSYDSNERTAAAIEAVEKIPNKQYIIIQSDFTIDGGKKAAQKLHTLPLKNIGIFALNDEIAIGLIEVLTHETIIKNNIQIIGFDNDVLGSYIQPKLATIGYSKHHWGETAAQVLIDQINHKEQIDDYLINTYVMNS